MKTKAIIRAVILSAFAIASIPSYSAFLSLPTSGDPSAYIACATSGNFGSGTTLLPPTDGCLVTQSGAQPPDSIGAGAGHAMAAGYAKTRPIQLNNVYTGGLTKTLGSIQDWVWKNAAGTSCIYGMKITMALSAPADYQPAAGNQYFEVNDVARGGFAGRSIMAAYAYPGTPSELVYRIGRTYTSVQHRVTGYTSLPLTGLGSQPSINGVDSLPGTASAAQQLADHNENWVDFTTHVNARHNDGSMSGVSSWVFVKADSCPALNPNTGLPIDTPDAIRLRQTYQENIFDGINPGTERRFIEISLPGFAPAGANVLPAHTNPY